MSLERDVRLMYFVLCLFEYETRPHLKNINNTQFKARTLMPGT
jgi:hypothetical protein